MKVFVAIFVLSVVLVLCDARFHERRGRGHGRGGFDLDSRRHDTASLHQAIMERILRDSVSPHRFGHGYRSAGHHRFGGPPRGHHGRGRRGRGGCHHGHDDDGTPASTTEAPVYASTLPPTDNDSTADPNEGVSASTTEAPVHPSTLPPTDNDSTANPNDGASPSTTEAPAHPSTLAPTEIDLSDGDFVDEAL